jgi:flagellar capping protein FliD
MDITDFSSASYSTLDLSKLLQNVVTSPLSSILHVTASNGSDIVSVNPTGNGFVQVATLHGITANAADLVQQGAIRI